MYDTSLTYGTSGAAAIVQQMGIGIWAISIGISILTIASMWKLFLKLGEDGWKSIIPIYNIIILLKHADMNPKLLFLLLIPCVGSGILMILYIMAIVKIAKKLGKEGGGIIALAIFLPYIALAVLAFGKTKEVGTAAPAAPVEAQTAAPVTENIAPTPGIEPVETPAPTPVMPVETPVAPAMTTATPENADTNLEQTAIFTPMPEPPVAEPTPAVEAPVVEPTPVAETPVVEPTPAVQQPQLVDPIPTPEPPVVEPTIDPAQNIVPPVMPTIDDNNNNQQ